MPILSEKAGRVKFHDIIEGVTMKQETDETTGQEAMVVIEHKEDLHPQIIICDDKGEPIANYPIPSGAHIVVAEGDRIVAGTLMAKTPRKTSKTKDITGGLPRVAELFEARRPKDAAEISKIEGIVDFGPSVRGKRCIVIKDQQTAVEEEHLIPIGKHVIVFKGDYVEERPAAYGRPGRSARNPRHLRSAGASGAPRQRSPGSLSAARRDHQRQAR